jgi:hypothetical protein
MNLNESFAPDAAVLNTTFSWILILPECSNAVFLMAGIYGMFHGIEISHPLYAVLFLSLWVPFLATAAELAAFCFVSSETFMKLCSAVGGVAIQGSIQ